MQGLAWTKPDRTVVAEPASWPPVWLLLHPSLCLPAPKSHAPAPGLKSDPCTLEQTLSFTASQGWGGNNASPLPDALFIRNALTVGDITGI